MALSALFDIYDMKFGGAKQFILTGCESEKIRIRLVSNTMPTLQNDFKVRIDDTRKRIDVDVNRRNGVTEAFGVPDAENIIELNGIKSELVISACVFSSPLLRDRQEKNWDE